MRARSSHYFVSTEITGFLFLDSLSDENWDPLEALSSQFLTLRSTSSVLTVRDMLLNDSILVTGSHRSGTTWLGNVLALAENTRYVQEPFNRETNEKLGDYRLGAMYAHAYDENLPELKKGVIEHVNYQEGERLILKDPIALFSAPWIQDEFGTKVICIVRHPAGFVSSLIKWKWEFHFGYFTDQPKLMDSFSPEIRSEVERYSKERQEPILQACLLWKTIYGWMLSQDPKSRKWVVVNYEDLANKPKPGFKKIYKKLGLKWNFGIANSVKQMSGNKNPKESDDPGFKARNSQAMREVWKTRLSQDEIELIKTETSPVWENFYKKSDW